VLLLPSVVTMWKQSTELWYDVILLDDLSPPVFLKLADVLRMNAFEDELC